MKNFANVLKIKLKRIEEVEYDEVFIKLRNFLELTGIYNTNGLVLEYDSKTDNHYLIYACLTELEKEIEDIENEFEYIPQYEFKYSNIFEVSNLENILENSSNNILIQIKENEVKVYYNG